MLTRARLSAASLVAVALGLVFSAGLPCGHAFTIRGTGAGALVGGDFTDPENNGDPENNVGYNATFAASEEPTFGGAEGAFNVFDNQVGGGNAKWCCGDQNNFPVNPISIDATFSTPFRLDAFTLTSGNDTPDRDPRVFQILGSNDGTNFLSIYSRADPTTSPWTGRDQVLQFDAGNDYPVQTASYTTFRFITTATGLATGARFQLAEIEYVPEPGVITALVGGIAVLGLVRRVRR